MANRRKSFVTNMALNTAQPHAELPTLSVLPGALAQLLAAFAVGALAARVHVVHLPAILPHALREWARLRLRPRRALTPARPCSCFLGSPAGTHARLNHAPAPPAPTNTGALCPLQANYHILDIADLVGWRCMGSALPVPRADARGEWRHHGLRRRPGILGASGPAVVAHAARLALHISGLSHLGRLPRAAHLLLGLGGRGACLLSNAAHAAHMRLGQHMFTSI